MLHCLVRFASHREILPQPSRVRIGAALFVLLLITLTSSGYATVPQEYAYLRNSAKPDEAASIVVGLIKQSPQDVQTIALSAVHVAPQYAPLIIYTCVLEQPGTANDIVERLIASNPWSATVVVSAAAQALPKNKPSIALAARRGLIKAEQDGLLSEASRRALEQAITLALSTAQGPNPQVGQITVSQRPNPFEIVTASASPERWGEFGSTPFAILRHQTFDVVRVFYVTDRNYIPNSEPAYTYGPKRGDIAFGQCFVSIPRIHKVGNLEERSISRFRWFKDNTKDVLLDSLAPMQVTDFFNAVRRKIADSNAKRAFIFIHGYNVTFENAARRTAQIYYDLGFDGAPLFYSWPSEGRPDKYPTDEANIEWSEPNITRFLVQLLDTSTAQEIYLIAHSMGSRAMVKAVTKVLSQRPDARTRFKEIILTAPDIDADIFKRDIAPGLTAFTRTPAEPARVTLYVSAKDQALVLSQKFHSYLRIGDARGGAPVVPGIDTVDATDANTDFIGHSYFAENKSVISDLYYLLRDNYRPEQRPDLITVPTTAGPYWLLIDPYRSSLRELFLYSKYWQTAPLIPVKLNDKP